MEVDLWDARLHAFEAEKGEQVAIDGKEFDALKKINELNLTSAKATVADLVKLSKQEHAEDGVEIWLSRLRHAYSM